MKNEYFQLFEVKSVLSHANESLHCCKCKVFIIVNVKTFKSLLNFTSPDDGDLYNSDMFKTLFESKFILLP